MAVYNVMLLECAEAVSTLLHETAKSDAGTPGAGTNKSSEAAKETRVHWVAIRILR